MDLDNNNNDNQVRTNLIEWFFPPKQDTVLSRIPVCSDFLAQFWGEGKRLPQEVEDRIHSFLSLCTLHRVVYTGTFCPNCIDSTQDQFYSWIFFLLLSLAQANTSTPEGKAWWHSRFPWMAKRK